MVDTAFIGRVEAPGLQVMSFNIRRRMPNVYPRLADRWPHRRPLVKRLLETEAPSIVGVQEALPDQASFVRHALGAQYRSIGYGREKGRRGEGCPLFYDRERLTLLDWSQTALSDTPLVQGSSTWGNRTPRMMVDAHFRDASTGLEFRAINTHFDNASRNARERSAVALREIAAASTVPVVITGDLNTDARTGPHDTLLSSRVLSSGESAPPVLVDAFDAARERLGESVGTFLDYHPPKRGHKRIDWILTTPDVAVLTCGINVTRYPEGWPSDHAPIQAVLRFAG